MWRAGEEEEIGLWLNALRDERTGKKRMEEAEWRMMILWKSTDLSCAFHRVQEGVMGIVTYSITARDQTHYGHGQIMKQRAPGQTSPIWYFVFL